MPTYEVRLTGTSPALIRGITHRPPTLLCKTESAREALGALSLHDRAKCFDEAGDVVERDALRDEMHGQHKAAREAAEEHQRIQEGLAEQQRKAKEDAERLAAEKAEAQRLAEEQAAAEKAAREQAALEALEAARAKERAAAEAQRLAEEKAAAEAQAAQEAVKAQEQPTDATQQDAPIVASSEGLASDTSTPANTDSSVEIKPETTTEIAQELLVLREGENFPPFNAGADKLNKFADSYGVSNEELWSHGGYSDAYNWLQGRFGIES